MSMTDNRSIIQKANFALSQIVAEGGLLQPLQAKKFMRLATIEAELLRMVNYRPMARVREEIDQIKFGSRVLHPWHEFVALTEGQRSVPNIAKVQL